MSDSRLPAAAVTLLLACAACWASEQSPRGDTPYVVVKTVPLGAPDRWDYLTYDAGSHRIYAAHGTSIDVFDGRSGEAIGKVPVPGANGVAVVPESGKGYAGSRGNKSVVVFDLQTLKVSRNVPVDEDTDAVVYDTVSKRVFVMEGDPHGAVAVDTRDDTVAGVISLAGDPEFAVVDGDGALFVNIADRKAIQRVNTRSLKVEATWPVQECESPHGLSIDVSSKRLFATCVNSKMVVVDATDGRVLQSFPIGQGTDGAGFDNIRKRAFSSNGSGTLSVLHVVGPDKYELLGETATQPLARTMTVDSQTGRIYLLAGERIEVDPTATNARKRYGVVPGSARLLFMDPRP
jgi:hypothetical protein